LAQGELGLETDTIKLKWGDGVTAWNGLAYFFGTGEGNTASNVGTGTSLFKQKTGVDLEFNGIKSENALLSISLDGGTNDIELTVNEGSIDHGGLAGLGDDDHTQYDRADGTRTRVKIQLDTALIAPAHSEGLLYYNNTDNALSFFNDISDVTLNIGEEMWVRGNNDVGAQIDNGQVVHITSATGGKPDFTLAQANVITGAEGVIGVVTHDIGIGAEGLATSFGLVRDVDTSAFGAGDTLWLDGVVAGGLVNAMPEFPNIPIIVGKCLVSDAVNGVILVNIVGTPKDIIYNNSNGTILESFDATVTSDGATITMSLEQSGGGDLTMQFSDGLAVLDCTLPVCTIALTAGTVASPQQNYIYIPKSTKVLTKSTSDWPGTEHIKIAYLFVQTAAYVASDGPLINQNWNDHVAGTDLMGHMTHIGENIRRRGAVYFSGLDGAGGDDYSTSGAGSVTLQVGAGVVYQMHKQTIASKDTSGADDLHVINAHATDGGAYLGTQNLYDITVDTQNVSLNNRYFNVVLIGVGNKSGEYAPLLVNIPNGSYNTLSGAQNDTSGHDVLDIPRQFNIDSSTGFYICRLTFRKAGGTWVYQSTVDLRGTTPSSVSGGAAGGTTTNFSDNLFTVFNNTDPTKIIALLASTIASGNTRTFTAPDNDGVWITSGNLTDITTVGTIGTGTWEATDVGVAHGGSGRSSSTAYAVVCGGTTGTAAHQSIASVGTADQVLTSNGAGALPTFQDASGGGGFPIYNIYADMVENPNNADWTVNALAPAASDSNNNGLTVRLFDDGTDEGIGFTLRIPTGATNIKFSFVSRAESTPGGAVQVALDVYEREIPDNSAVTAWSAATSLTLLDFPTNENFQYDDQTISLVTLGLTAGSTHQFELARDTDDGDDDLVGDWALLEIIVEFT